MKFSCPFLGVGQSQRAGRGESVEMFRGDVEAGQAGHQQAVPAPHPLQEAAPALLPQQDGAAGSPGGETVAAAGPP